MSEIRTFASPETEFSDGVVEKYPLLAERGSKHMHLAFGLTDHSCDTIDDIVDLPLRDMRNEFNDYTGPDASQRRIEFKGKSGWHFTVFSRNVSRLHYDKLYDLTAVLHDSLVESDPSQFCADVTARKFGWVGTGRRKLALLVADSPQGHMRKLAQVVNHILYMDRSPGKGWLPHLTLAEFTEGITGAERRQVVETMDQYNALEQLQAANLRIRGVQLDIRDATH